MSLSSEPALLRAIECGDAAQIRQIVTANPKILSLKDETGQSILHLAVLTEILEGVRVLVQLGADTSIKCDAGLTPLQLVESFCDSDHAEMKQLLQEKGFEKLAFSSETSSPNFQRKLFLLEAAPNPFSSPTSSSIQAQTPASPLVGQPRKSFLLEAAPNPFSSPISSSIQAQTPASPLVGQPRKSFHLEAAPNPFSSQTPPQEVFRPGTSQPRPSRDGQCSDERFASPDQLPASFLEEANPHGINVTDPHDYANLSCLLREPPTGRSWQMDENATMAQRRPHLTAAQRQKGHYVRRILLLGKTGEGKSSLGNLLLGGDYFVESASSLSCTKICSIYNNGLLEVIDSPGLSDTEGPDAEVEVIHNIGITLDECRKGGVDHIFVLCADRLTKESCLAINNVFKLFVAGPVGNASLMDITTIVRTRTPMYDDQQMCRSIAHEMRSNPHFESIREIMDGVTGIVFVDVPTYDPLRPLSDLRNAEALVKRKKALSILMHRLSYFRRRHRTPSLEEIQPAYVEFLEKMREVDRLNKSLVDIQGQMRQMTAEHQARLKAARENAEAQLGQMRASSDQRLSKARAEAKGRLRAEREEAQRKIEVSRAQMAAKEREENQRLEKMLRETQERAAKERERFAAEQRRLTEESRMKALADEAFQQQMVRQKEEFERQMALQAEQEALARKIADEEHQQQMECERLALQQLQADLERERRQREAEEAAKLEEQRKANELRIARERQAQLQRLREEEQRMQREKTAREETLRRELQEAEAKRLRAVKDEKKAANRAKLKAGAKTIFGAAVVVGAVGAGLMFV